MTSPIRLDRTPEMLRELAKVETNARVALRMLAIANALAGMSRGKAARSAGMDGQTLCDWVNRYNAHGLEGLADRWHRGGRPPKLSAHEKAELIAIVLAGPDRDALTCKDLVHICKERFDKSLSITSTNRILREAGLPRRKVKPSRSELTGMSRYNAHWPEGLANRRERQPKLSANEKAELVAMLRACADPASGIPVFTRKDLVNICQERFGKNLQPKSIGGIVREAGLPLSRRRFRESALSVLLGSMAIEHRKSAIACSGLRIASKMSAASTGRNLRATDIDGSRD
jgi:transposase